MSRKHRYDRELIKLVATINPGIVKKPGTLEAWLFTTIINTPITEDLVATNHPCYSNVAAEHPTYSISQLRIAAWSQCITFLDNITKLDLARLLANDIIEKAKGYQRDYKRACFFDLLGELRNRIYHYAVVSWNKKEVFIS